MINCHGRAPPSAAAIQSHQPAGCHLVQRFEAENARARFNRSLRLPGLFELRHQSGKNIDGLIPVARRFCPTPGFERLALDAEPIKQIAGTQFGGSLQVRPTLVRSQAAKGKDIRI
jgi:hypothetical protein